MSSYVYELRNMVEYPPSACDLSYEEYYDVFYGDEVEPNPDLISEQDVAFDPELEDR